MFYVGCVSLADQKCHKNGEEWVDMYKTKCIHFVCKKVGKKYRPRKVREGNVKVEVNIDTFLLMGCFLKIDLNIFRYTLNQFMVMHFG